LINYYSFLRITDLVTSGGVTSKSSQSTIVDTFTTRINKTIKIKIGNTTEIRKVKSVSEGLSSNAISIHLVVEEGRWEDVLNASRFGGGLQTGILAASPWPIEGMKQFQIKKVSTGFQGMIDQWLLVFECSNAMYFFVAATGIQKLKIHWVSSMQATQELAVIAAKNYSAGQYAFTEMSFDSGVGWYVYPDKIITNSQVSLFKSLQENVVPAVQAEAMDRKWTTQDKKQIDILGYGETILLSPDATREDKRTYCVICSIPYDIPQRNVFFVLVNYGDVAYKGVVLMGKRHFCKDSGVLKELHTAIRGTK